MSTLTLDYTQRLNLHALIGAQRGSVDDVRLYWKLQDKIELSDEEREKINFRVIDVNGQQQAAWDLVPNAPVEYEFTAEELSRLSRVIKEWQAGFVAADRRWLEPLLAQLDHVSTNGNQPKLN
jgi:hypothetical protein